MTACMICARHRARVGAGQGEVIGIAKRLSRQPVPRQRDLDALTEAKDQLARTKANKAAHEADCTNP